MNTAYLIDIDSGNNTSICYMITIGGKRLLILGDLPHEAAEQLLQDRGSEVLKADIVQAAHHGQHGGSQAFYTAVSPKYVLWPSHSELWEQRNAGFDPAQTVYTVALTKYWFDQLGVSRHYVMAEGDWILR